jgi:hypothetical protein
MLEFRKANVNPMKKRVGDCSTRALSNVLNISYEEAIREQCETAIKTCYGLTDKELVDEIMNKYGYIKMKQPRKSNGKKYDVNEMDQVLTKKQIEDGVLIKVAKHFTVIKNGDIQDIWNCGYMTVGNYWIRKGE